MKTRTLKSVVKRVLVTKSMEKKLRLVTCIWKYGDVSLLTRELLSASSIRQRFLGAWLLAANSSQSPLVRAESFEMLKRTISHESNAKVLSRAIQSLGSYGSAKSDLLVASYYDHDAASVRLAVAQSFSNMTKGKARQCLVDLLHDKSPLVREWAAFKLGQQSGKATRRTLACIRQALSDSSRQVRLEALRALIWQGDYSALSSIAGSLKNLTLRSSAVLEFLGEIEERLCQFGLEEEIVDALVEIWRRLFIPNSEISRKQNG